MTNQEVLEKLREAEQLVIRALRIMHEVRAASVKSENADGIKRKDQTACSSLITHLFRLVEPHVVSGADEDVEIDVESDWAPRGELGGFRLRYEIICGYRQWAGYPNPWKYPKVNPSNS